MKKETGIKIDKVALEAAQTRNCRKEYSAEIALTITDYLSAIYDRAALDELLRNDGELYDVKAKEPEGDVVERVADILCEEMGQQVLHQAITDVDEAAIAEHDYQKKEWGKR